MGCTVLEIPEKQPAISDQLAAFFCYREVKHAHKFVYVSLVPEYFWQIYLPFLSQSFPVCLKYDELQHNVENTNTVTLIS